MVEDELVEFFRELAKARGGSGDPHSPIVYHGTSVMNAGSILQKGILPRLVTLGKQFMEAAQRIICELGLGISVTDIQPWDRRYVEKRIAESRRHGGVVYVSRDKQYAEKNALAGLEWFKYLVDSILAVAHKGLYLARDKARADGQCDLARKLNRDIDDIRKKALEKLLPTEKKAVFRIRMPEKKLKELTVYDASGEIRLKRVPKKYIDPDPEITT